MEEFTIYYGILPDGRRKIGVDSNYPKRIRNQKLTDHRILEVHTDVYEVSDREQELQARNGLEVDTLPYYKLYFRNKSENMRDVVRDTHTGKVVSEETRAKISAANTGKVHTEEAKAKMSNTRKGIPKSEEHKAKIGAANTGRLHTEETKDKISAAGKGNTNGSGKKGIPQPKVQCPHCDRIISTSNIGRHIKVRHS